MRSGSPGDCRRARFGRKKYRRPRSHFFQTRHRHSPTRCSQLLTTAQMHPALASASSICLCCRLMKSFCLLCLLATPTSPLPIRHRHCSVRFSAPVVACEIIIHAVACEIIINAYWHCCLRRRLDTSAAPHFVYAFLATCSVVSAQSVERALSRTFPCLSLHAR